MATLDRPARLLSLDGGGIRGLSELSILDVIMHRIKSQLKLDYEPLPADYFDMIGGTSTGGLIALLLGRLRMPVSRALDAYTELSKEVFGEKNALWKDGKFKHQNLEKAIKRVVNEMLGDENARMLDSSNAACKVFVCATQAQNVGASGGPRKFRTYGTDSRPTYDCCIWEAGRATSAAPTFFESIDIGPSGRQQRFLDAGLGYNNPVKEVVREAEQVFGAAQKISCIVSIGTGQPKPVVYQKPKGTQKVVPIQLVQALADLATDTQKVAEEMSAKHARAEPVYWRLNVEQGLENIGLDEWNHLGEVEGYTHDYLDTTEADSKITAIVEAILRGGPVEVDGRRHVLGRLYYSLKELSANVTAQPEPPTMVRWYTRSATAISNPPPQALMQAYSRTAETIVSAIRGIEAHANRVNNSSVPHHRIILDRRGFVHMLHARYRELLDNLELPLHVLVFNSALKMDADFRHILASHGEIVEQSNSIITASHTMPLFMFAPWPFHYTYNVYIFYAGRVTNRGGDGHNGRGFANWEFSGAWEKKDIADKEGERGQGCRVEFYPMWWAAEE